MTNHSNPLEVLLERLGCVDPAKGAFFFWDEVKDWPAGALDVLMTSGLLQQAQPRDAIECDGCEENCINKPVVVYPAQEGKPGRAFIVCDENNDMGRIRVSFDRMRQWQTTGDLIAGVLARLLGFSASVSTASETNQWNLGVLKGKKHKSRVTLLADDGFKLLLAGHAVPLVEVLAIEKNVLTLDKGELIRLVDKPEGDDEVINVNQGISGNQCTEFVAMPNLVADEISIAFVGEKTEFGLGANTMLEISARGKTNRVTLATLDLVDKRGGALNSLGAILLGMVQKRPLPSSGANSAKMTRLRRLLKIRLGIRSDPFYAYVPGAGWQPRFNIEDRRGAADERAKRDAERKTVSFDQLIEQGTQFGGSDPAAEQLDTGDDDAARWLRENDPSASS